MQFYNDVALKDLMYFERKKESKKLSKAGLYPSLLPVFRALTALRAEASEHLLLVHINNFWTKMP